MEKENKVSRGFFKRLGLLPLILFWLAIEYLAVSFNFHWWIFLADIVPMKSEWLRWTRYTGYLGASFWMLMALLLLYLTLTRKDRRWQFAVILVIVIVGPILYSYTLPPSTATPAEGEWVGRTAAWISVLVLLSAIVKEFIRKK